MKNNLAIAAPAAALLQATVIRVEGDGAVVVRPTPGGEEVICALLHTGNAALVLAPRDEVLIWQPEPQMPRAVVLGRVGISHAPPDAPDELVLEARSSLTIRCGDGSITFREDGKILIKGKDLVSHADRTNRIRGGSVAIN
jgi:hypothetical protein